MSEKAVVKHEAEFFHVRKGSLFALIATLFFSVLAYFNSFLLSFEWMSYGLFETFVLADLTSVYPYLAECFFLACAIISFVAILKGGFENGLIAGLVAGLITGFILGLIIGFVSGFILGLIAPLIIVFIFGLVSGLVIGLVYGLKREFTGE